MRNSDEQIDSRERLSLAALVLTIVITNVAVFVYVAPYT
jgi:hypothetical protein